MLTASRDIQLHLLAATVHSPLNSPQIGDQGPQLYAPDLSYRLEHCIRICHLGHGLGVHKGSYFDDLDAGVDQAAKQFHLFFGRNQGFLILEAIPQANLTQGNGRGQVIHSSTSAVQGVSTPNSFRYRYLIGNSQ